MDPTQVRDFGGFDVTVTEDFLESLPESELTAWEAGSPLAPRPSPPSPA